MVRAYVTVCLAAFAWGALAPAVSAQVTYDKNWSYNKDKGYYYKKCAFPRGGHQYLVYYKSKPNWVYWYNPTTQVYWCACPTVNHPKWGQDIKNGKDLFLMATTKDRDLERTKFPDDANGANFKKGKAKDSDGSEVDLSCPPPDLP